MTLRHIALFFTLLLVLLSEGRAVGIERVAKKNGVFELADIGAVGKKVLGILEKAPVKADIISEFGVKIQSNVDDILAVFPNESTHLFYQKLIGRSDEIHEAILNNVGDIGLRSADDLTVFFDDIAAAGEELMEAFATNPSLVKSWEQLVGLPESKTWVRRNVDLLEKMDGVDIVDQNLVNLFYTTFKPVNFSSPPPTTVNGIFFNKFGFPDFKPSAPNMPDGSRAVFNATDHPNGFLSGAADDMTMANNWALNKYGSSNFRKIPGSTKCEIKIGNDWVEHTWHHFEDGRNMFPVPSTIHSSVQHTGGASVIDKSLEDFFDPLIF